MRPLSTVCKETWGNEAIKTLAEYYGKPRTHTYSVKSVVNNKTVTEQHSVTSAAVLSCEDVIKEWIDLKDTVLAQMYPRDNFAELWGLVGRYHIEDFPNMVKLAHLALSCPAQTAGCERGFSAQNLILSPLRNRLSGDNMDMLLRVKLHVGSLDYEEVYDKWNTSKNRRF